MASGHEVSVNTHQLIEQKDEEAKTEKLKRGDTEQKTGAITTRNGTWGCLGKKQEDPASKYGRILRGNMAYRPGMESLVCAQHNVQSCHRS